MSVGKGPKLIFLNFHTMDGWMDGPHVETSNNNNTLTDQTSKSRDVLGKGLKVSVSPILKTLHAQNLFPPSPELAVLWDDWLMCRHLCFDDGETAGGSCRQHRLGSKQESSHTKIDFPQVAPQMFAS